MGKPSPPKPASPQATAAAQTASNQQTAITQAGLNSVNQVTPYGNLTYSQDGRWADGTPKFTATQSLSPAQQQLLNTTQGTTQQIAETAQGQAGRLDNLLSTPFSLDNDATEARLMELGRKRLDPLLAQRSEMMESDLLNRGIRPGSTNYDRAQDTKYQAENDAYNSLLLGGRSQAINEALTERNQPLNEIIGLMSGSQVQQPQFMSTPQTGVAGTDVGGITANYNNNQQSAYNTNLGQWNSTAGGLFGLGASALPLMFGMSDRTLKKDISDTGLKVAGVPVKTWRWKDGGEPSIGVIAQELERKHPELVAEHPSGKKMVNYGGLMALGAKKKAA